MAFPSFSKSGVTTFTFSRGDTFPHVRRVVPRQRVGISEAGSVHVATLSPPEYEHVLTFEGLSATDYTALQAFLTDPLINWAAFSFTLTDVDSATYTVRYLGGLDMPQVSAGRYNVTIRLREEIP